MESFLEDVRHWISRVWNGGIIVKKNYDLEYCTAKDIQLCLQISLSKAYEIMKQPECKAIKIGGTIRVKRQNLDAYLKMAEKRTEENMRLHQRMNRSKQKH